MSPAIKFDLNANALFKTRYSNECNRVNKIMMWLMVAQWVVGILFALFYSPFTWIGQNYQIHVHVWAAILLGGAISGTSIFWTRRFPDAAHTRHVNAIAQMLWSALLIHLSGGRIETHFHVFASLAILSIYRDWKILVTATIVVAIDHFVRGVFYPLSAFGVVTESPYRWMEHAAWVLFEVAFLIPSCMRLKNEIMELCIRQTEIEKAKTSVDLQVKQRTKELVAANELLAEKSLELSKLALVAKHTDNAVVVTDSESRIEWVNEGFIRMTGYSLSDVAGKRPADFRYGEQTDPNVLETAESAIANNRGYDIEIISYRKNGEPYWSAIEGRPISDGNGSVSRFISIENDISQRKAMEISLAAAEQRLRSLVNNVPGAFFRCDVENDFSILFMSHAIEEITGHKVSDFVETQTVSRSDLLHPADRNLVETTINDAIANQKLYEIEYRIVDREQNIKWLLERGQCLVNDNGKTILDGMVFDITERKSSEANLASMGQMIEESLTEIFIFDMETWKFIYANHAAIENTGYSLEELQEASPLKIKPEFDREKFQKLLDPLSSGQQSQIVFQTLHERKNGSKYNTEIRLQQSRYHDTDVYLATVIDITNRVKAESKNNRLQAELVSASRDAGMAEVATGVLHNVGNILNSVNVSASVIRNRFEKSAFGNLARVTDLIADNETTFADFVRDDNRGQKLPAYIQRVTEALSKERDEVAIEFTDLLKNVEHIKEIVTVQQSMAKSSGVMQDLCPQDIVTDVLAATKGSTTNHQITVIEDIADSITSFVSDKHKVLQILINLISNAKDALVEQKTLDPKIEIQVICQNDDICFRVSDNGVGIHQNKINKIFQHGFTTKKTGHGFGLHSSANAATEIGGSLTVSSQGIGHGATFELLLPISAPVATASTH